MNEWGFIGAVGVAQHASLEEVFLLRVLLQQHEELTNIILLLETQRKTQ